MARAPTHTPLGWALFLWDGRISRRVFILGTLFWVMVNAAAIAFAANRVADDSNASSAMLFFLASASLSLVSLVMLGIKRAHDLGMPGVIAMLLVIPAFSLIAFALLCALPSMRGANLFADAPDRRGRAF